MNPLDALARWDEPDPAVLDRLTRTAMSAADTAVISAGPGSPHDMVKTGVRAALRCLLANGIITAVPQEDWPEYVRVDAP